jgi:tetratricopeptide (TPR) repeat protein
VLRALIVGLGFALVGFRRAVAAREEAEAITGFLARMLAAANPSTGGEKDVSVRAVLDEAAKKVSAEFGDRPLLRARLHEVIGQTYSGLGFYEPARAQYAETLAVRARELGAHHELTLRIGLDHAEMHSVTDKVPEAETLLRAILAQYDRRPGSYPAADRGWACFMIGNCLAAQGRTDEAAVFDQRAADIFGQAFGPWHETTLKAKGNVIANFINTGEPRRALPLLDGLVAQPSLPESSPTRLVFVLNAAVAETAVGAHERAEAHIREAERLASAAYGDEHRLTLNARYLLGDELVRQGDLAGGIALLERTAEIQERVLGRDEFSTLEVRAALQRARGVRARSDAALPSYREILTVWREKRGLDAGYFVAVRGLVEVLAATARWSDAEAECRAALAAMDAARSRDEYTRADFCVALGEALFAQGNPSAAEVVWRSCQERLRGLDFDVSRKLAHVAAALERVQPQPRAGERTRE